MAVLLRLAAADGHVVSRESLLADVWPNVIVSDTALSRCIYQLRKVLGEVSGADTSPVETLPKRGYRLAWPVDAGARNPGPVRERTRTAGMPWKTLAAVVLAVLVVSAVLRLPERWTEGFTTDAEVRLVVFPPDDLSPTRDQRPFATGLAREIAHDLASLPGLTVIGRNSSLGELPREASITGQAEQLDADYVLGGTIRTIGSSRRVLLDLRSLPGNEVLWSHTFLLDATASFDILRRVVWETARLLEFSLDPNHPHGSTDRLDAFQAYLAAGQTQDYAAKKNHLERAVRLDPEFARAWNRLAAIEVMPVWNGVTTVEEAWSRAEPNVRRALEIVPDMPDALVTLGRFRREFGDLDGAIALFEKALEQDPGHAYAAANLGLVLRFSGRFEEALEVHRLAAAMDPLDAAAVTRLGTSYWFVENHDEAERHYRRAAELAPEYEEIYDSWAGMLAMGRGRFDLALAKIEEKIRIEGHATPRSLATKASLADTLGLFDMADEYWHRTTLASSPQQGIDARQAWNLMARGDPLAAGELLRRGGLTQEPDPDAQLVLGLIDLSTGATVTFLERARDVFARLNETRLLSSRDDIGGALVLALACQANGRHETAERLLQNVQDLLTDPLSREHFWLATVYAMRGNVEDALHELEASPPGWVRGWAPLAMQDARFAALRDAPSFRTLIAGHLDELDRQRNAYLAGRDAARMTLAN